MSTSLLSYPGISVSVSGRPRRNVATVNYAEASGEDESAKGSGGARKRMASQSPATLKKGQAKSIMKSIAQAAAIAAIKAEAEEQENKPKGKVVASLSFGANKKIQSGPSPRYFTHLMIACEQIVSRNESTLADFHKATAKLLPFNPTNIDKFRAAMECILTKRVLERIEAQLNALGPHGAPSDLFVSKSAREPLTSTCSKCSSKRSFLTTICTDCKRVGTCTINPYVDWREAVLKQRELDEYDAANPIIRISSVVTIKGRSKSDLTPPPSASPPLPAPSPSPIARSSSVASDASTEPPSPHKRAKTNPHSSPSSSTITVPQTPSKMKNASALEGIPYPDADWILQAREDITLRAIEWLRTCMTKAKNHEFNFHGGDIIFLLRNAIFKARGEVSRRADAAVRGMIDRWNSGMLPIISDASEPAHILVFSECLHAKKEMKCASEEEILRITERVRSALTNHCVEDILRFDASLYQNCLPTQAYCHPCGVFHASAGKSRECPICTRPLRMEPDFEFLCESLVWVSLFKELGIEPVQTADATVTLDHILGLMKTIRPYRSLETAGTDSYKLQCYFITHLTFIMTGWGSVAMQPRELFVEEYLFLLANMDVVIKVKDPELVGEFLQALHILDTPHSHPAMQKGYHFLLTHEKKGKMRGNWMAASDEFYKRYHAAYCGIIGMADFKFDPNLKFDTRYNHHFM